MTSLFQDFKPVSSKEWKQKIQFDLKGADYQTLLTHTIEKIDIKPFYHLDSYHPFENVDNGNSKIVQFGRINDENIANKIAKNALNKGADYYSFSFDRVFHIESVIQNLDFDKLIFKSNILDVDFISELYGKTLGKAQILLDPIGHFSHYGNWYTNEKTDFDQLKKLQNTFPADYKFIGIGVDIYKNAGASVTQELAYALSHAVEYIEKLDISVANRIQFNFAIGNHYFFEIAKFKVFRYLWQLILDEYGVNADIVIHAQPSIRNKTVFDSYINMLRTGIEMMSAILGGVDFVGNLPFDSVYKKTNEFSERIAKNQLLVLKEEAYLKKASNSFEGTYYLENISGQIAEKALEIFKQIEKGNGFLAQLYKEKIQEKIAETANHTQNGFDKGKVVLVGSNKYINESEKPEKIEIYPFLRKRSGQTLVRPIVSKRLAEEIEIKRLNKLGIKF